MSTKNSNDIIWDRTSDFPICSTIRKRVSRKERTYRKKPEHKIDKRKWDRKITNKAARRWFQSEKYIRFCRTSDSKYSLTQVCYHGVYGTPVLFDSRFFLYFHEYCHRLFVFYLKAFVTMSHTFASFCIFSFIFHLCLFPLGDKWTP
jgi:hypothetical protein